MKNILIVDDDEMIPELIRGFLDHNNDYLFEHAESLSDAIRKSSRKDYDLALLDLGLPDSSGLETIKRYRIATNNNVPVIVVTGSEDIKIRMHSMDYGAWDFFQKTKLNYMELMESIERVISCRERVQSISHARKQMREGFVRARTLGVSFG